MDKCILKHLEEIVSKEEKLNSDKIVAEIIHLPESRIGNILIRPDLREYEISYLAKSNKNSDKSLNISDITISLKNNRLILKSKTHNREIVPKLTTAHNHTGSVLPIYKFLCDLQEENIKKYTGLPFPKVANKLGFVPRIRIGNIILSKASWFLHSSDFKAMKENGKKPLNLVRLMNDFMIKYNLPQYVLYSEGDNELLINLKNELSIKTLLNSIKNRKHIQLSEFLFNKESAIKNNKGEVYSNQIVVSFYKTKSKNLSI